MERVVGNAELGDNLDVIAGYSYLDTEIIEGGSASGATGNLLADHVAGGEKSQGFPPGTFRHTPRYTEILETSAGAHLRHPCKAGRAAA
jgi:hypothetical protein